MDFESISMQMTEKCKCMASSSRVLKIDCQEVITAHTTNISTGLRWSINSTIIKFNILNVHIHYVREYPFDFAVDLEPRGKGCMLSLTNGILTSK